MRKIILLIGDLALLYGALAITLWLRFSYIDTELWYKHLSSFSIVFAMWILIFFINGLYELNKIERGFKFYGTLVQNLAINTILTATFFYIVGDITGIKPQTILIILVGVFVVLFLIWRKIFYKLISSDKLSSNLTIIGVNTESLLLAEEIIKKPQLGYQLKLIINPDSSLLNEKINNIDISRDISEMREKILEHKINTVVAINDPKYSPEVARHLFENIDLKIQYFNLTDFYEKITGKMPISSLERHWFLENITQKNQQWLTISKRILDIALAIFFGIISLLILPWVALAVKLESKGPLIYKQARVGLNNKIFTVYKLRSMAKNAEKDGVQWAKENDSRVTKIGKFIRKTRIDEIPQFINILKGNMSFVGPRPERPEFVNTLKEEIPFYNERHLVKPGLTGWAQINFPYGASVADAKEKLQYDLFYIKNQSTALDISIILKTINTVFNKSLGR